jgi:hypothetical protein
MSIISQILANPDRYSVQELQQGMQSGMIPGYVAIPLIQDKVQSEQRRKMAMMGQGAPGEEAPTVAEDVLQQANMDEGLLALQSNLPEEEQSYAPGGIVAFEHGGHVPGYASGVRVRENPPGFSMDELLGQDYEQTSEGIAALAPYAEQAEETPEETSDIVNAARRNLRFVQQDLLGKAPSSAEDLAALRGILDERRERAAEDAKTAKERNIVGLLANIAASRDPYSSVAIGSGVAKSMPDFSAAEAAQRKQEMDDAMARLSLTKSEREEAIAGLPAAMQLTGYEADVAGKKATAAARLGIARYQVAKDRDTFGDRQVMRMANAVAQKDHGKPLAELPLDLQRTILGRASIDYQNTVNAAQFAGVAQRGEAAAGELGARISAIEESARNRATDAVTASLNNPRSPEAKEMKRIYREQGPDAASSYKQSLINDYIKGKTSAPPQKGGTPSPAPKAAPKASATTKPTLQQFLEAARAKNPGVTDDALKAYYRKNYG